MSSTSQIAAQFLSISYFRLLYSTMLKLREYVLLSIVTIALCKTVRFRDPNEESCPFIEPNCNCTPRRNCWDDSDCYPIPPRKCCQDCCGGFTCTFSIESKNNNNNSSSLSLFDVFGKLRSKLFFFTVLALSNKKWLKQVKYKRGSSI